MNMGIVEGEIGKYRMISNIDVRQRDRNDYYNNGPLENIESYFRSSSYQGADQFTFLNFTGQPLTIKNRDNTEFIIDSSRPINPHAPSEGLYVRRTFTTWSKAWLSYDKTRMYDIEPTQESIVFEEMILRYNASRQNHVRRHDELTEEFIDYYIPLDVLGLDGKPVYIHELDIVVRHTNHKYAWDHPLATVKSKVNAVKSFMRAHEEKQQGSFNAFVVDHNKGLGDRYLAIGKVVIKLAIHHDFSLDEGFYFQTENEFVIGKGETIAEMHHVSIEEAHKMFSIGITPEEALMRAQQENIILQREANQIKHDELKLSKQALEEKALDRHRMAQLAEINQSVQINKTANELWQRNYTQRRDSRGEILEWLKFVVAAIGSLFMIFGAFKRT